MIDQKRSSELVLPQIDLDAARKVVSAVSEYKRRVGNNAVLKMGFDEFDQFVLRNNSGQIAAVRALLEIDPRPFGFKGERYGIEGPPADLVEIPPVKYLNEQTGREMQIWTQYLREPAKKALDEMNAAMTKEIRTSVIVISAYRGQPYQAQLVLKHLVENNGDLVRALKWIALPGWSEHGSRCLAAVDLITPRGVGDDLGASANFRETDQYKWLLQNAPKYGYRESFPLDNSKGIGYEPWHWAWKE